MYTACIVGVSGWARVHYSDLVRHAERGNVRILGATVINQPDEPEKCAKLLSLGTELFTDFQTMLAKFHGKIDICHIPTGIHMHKPMTISSLRAGANVFVEKPAAATIQEVREMQAEERFVKRFVAVGYQTMYAHETMVMKKAIVEGAIGQVKTIRCRGLWPRDDSYYARNNWAGRLKNGPHWVLDSPYNNAISHQLNMICFLAGTEIEKTAKLESVQAELYHANDIESADTGCMRITTQSGIPLYFYVTHCPEGYLDPEIEVIGTEGSIHWDFREYRIKGKNGATGPQPTETTTLRDTIMDRLRARMTNPKTFICDLEIAAAQTIVVNGAHDSSPVQNVEEPHSRRSPSGESLRTVITGIDDIIARAYEDQKLFSEINVPWAKPGAVISVRNYERFPSVSPA